MLEWWAAVTPEVVAGLPTWALNGLSVGSLVTFILVGLATSRLWTKRQVDILREDHKTAQDGERAEHRATVEIMKDRYEKHLERTVLMLTQRADDAIRREEQWHDVANRWEEVARTLGDAVGDMQESSATTLAIVQEMQRSAPRRQGR